MYNALQRDEEGDIVPGLSQGPSQGAPAWKALLYVFLPSLVAFVALDMAWISLVAGAIYKDVLGDTLREQPDALSGLLAWACIVAALLLFALPRARSQQTAFSQGALLGVLLYGVYEWTNLSILKAWTWGLALTDIAWGGAVCGASTLIQWWLVQKLMLPAGGQAGSGLGRPQ